VRPDLFLLLPRRRAAAVLAAAAVAVVATGAAVPAHAASAPTLTTLTGEVVHGLASDTLIGAVSDNAPMRVALGLSVDTAARDSAYSAIFDKSSPDYHDFYTPASFRAAFGADPAVASRVLSFATAEGLQVSYDAPDGSYLELTGTAKEVDRTFDITENTYRGVNGLFTANAQAPTVPTGVAGVLGLTSLTTFTTAMSQTPKAATKTAKASKPAQDTCEPAAGTAGNLTAGPAGACLGETVPSDLWSVYDQPSADTGAGQKVAIFGEGTIADVVSDLRYFEAQEKLPTVPVKQILVGDNLTDSSGSEEWDLDSDASTGMSPNLQELDYYFGSDLSDASIGGTYSAWVNDPDGPMTGNSSFGGSEQLEYLGGFILDPILQEADMEGRTMFSSAGDVGGSCLPGANGVTDTGAPCVEYPASSPYVVGVGGTVLYTATTDATGATQEIPAARADEYSWNYSGGGQSDFEAAPAWQPAAFPLGTGTPCTVENTGDTCRGVPDVSAQSGDVVTNGYTIAYQGALTEEGGTSLSSPLWAGMWSRVEAAHASTCKSPFASGTASSSDALGFGAEDLYNLAENTTQDPLDFFDVGGSVDSMQSTNGQQVTMPRSALDPTGYDYVSGLGSPNVTNIIKALDCGNTTSVVADVPVSNDDIIETYDSQTGCSTDNTITDPVGDEVPAEPTNEALDLDSVTLSSTTTDLTFAATVTDLALNPGDLNYAFEFNYGSGTYAVSADRGAAGAANTFSLYSLSVTTAPVVGIGVEVAPTDLSDTLTGTFTGNVITVDMPLSTFNSTAAPATPLAAGGQLSGITIYTNDGPAATGIANDFNAEPVDQAEFFQCLFTLGSSGSTPVPEVPLVAAVPIIGLLAGAGTLVLRRRKARAQG
jgi:pseudomonalisin